LKFEVIYHCHTLFRCQKPLESDFKKGRISLAYENFKEFPKSLADILRIDITHLDLSMNDIQNFDFLKSFENLKALIVDGNTRMDTDTLPLNLNLELFYANKCEIEFPRSFVFRISVVFPNLKYFSMMDNPPIKRNEPFLSYDEAWLGREHRIRMLAIFIYLDLIHFNDKIITNLEREKSAEFHHYLGPVDSELEKFKSSVDTDNIVKILPVNLRDKALALLKIDETFDNDSDEGLVDVKISAYFASQDDNNISVASFFESKSKTKSKDAR
jgi:hypothetical protein